MTTDAATKDAQIAELTKHLAAKEEENKALRAMCEEMEGRAADDAKRSKLGHPHTAVPSHLPHFSSLP
jgi:hypothetical protein